MDVAQPIWLSGCHKKLILAIKTLKVHFVWDSNIMITMIFSQKLGVRKYLLQYTWVVGNGFVRKEKHVSISSTIHCFCNILVTLLLTLYSQLMPWPFTGPKMFCASPNYLSQPKNLTVLLSAFSKTFLLAQKQKYWIQIIFCSGTKCLWLAQYVDKFLVRHKQFGLAQNILGPVKGQGIR